MDRHLVLRGQTPGRRCSEEAVALLVQGFEKLLDRQPSFRDQTAKGAPRHFRVIGYRERGQVAGSCHDDMAPFLPDRLPTKSLKGLDDV